MSNRLLNIRYGFWDEIKDLKYFGVNVEMIHKDVGLDEIT